MKPTDQIRSLIAQIEPLLDQIDAGSGVPPVLIRPEVEVQPVVVVPPGGKIITLEVPPWTIGPAQNKQLYTAAAGHFGPNDVVVVAITAPAALANDAFGSIGWSDISSDPVQQRTVVLSETPGDFSHPLPGNGASSPAAETGSVNFSAGPNGSGYPAPTVPGRTVYCNFRNVNLVPSPTGTYDMKIEFRNPKN